MNISDVINDGSIKFKSNRRDSHYYPIKEKDQFGLFNNVSDIFYASFAIGFNFNKQKELLTDSINHVNLFNMDKKQKELMASLVLSRHSDEISNSKELWSIVERYAEYGVEVLHESLKRNHWVPVIDDLK